MKDGLEERHVQDDEQHAEGDRRGPQHLLVREPADAEDAVALGAAGECTQEFGDDQGREGQRAGMEDDLRVGPVGTREEQE